MNSAAVISPVAEINRLHAEAKQHAVASRRALGASLTAAWQAGHLLLVEKKRVRQTMGGGAWLLWLEQNFRGTPRTAQRYMKLAKGVADVAFLQGMSLRQAYDRLGIPMEEKHAGESFVLQPLAPHLLLASKLVRALPACDWQRFPAEKRAALRRDLAPLYQRMRLLFEDQPAVSPHSAIQQRS
jgi:hypothetical protein